jgi:hypothetical protein
MLDNDLIRLNQKLNVVLQMREDEQRRKLEAKLTQPEKDEDK